MEGANLSLTISVSGKPAPKITWYVQGRKIEDQGRYKITADKFEISEVRFEDQGMITCRAENLFGVRETKVELTVLGQFVNKTKLKTVNCIVDLTNFLSQN